MGIKIQLTPAELLAQSGEMKSLQADYESLFRSLNGVLEELNGSWSPNLANNFVGKIASVRSTLSNFQNILLQGATIAETSANTFSSVDQLLAKEMGLGDAKGGGGQGAFGGGGGGSRGGEEGCLAEDYRTAGAAVEAFDEWFQTLPQETQKMLKKLSEKLGVPVSALKITGDILTGKVDLETLNSFLEEIGTSDITSSVIINTFRVVFDLESKTRQLYDNSNFFLDQSSDHFLAGDYFEGAKDLAASVGTGLLSIAYGSFDVIGEVTGGFINATGGLISGGLNLVGAGLSSIPGLEGAGNLVNALSEGVHCVAETVGSFFKKLF